MKTSEESSAANPISPCEDEPFVLRKERLGGEPWNNRTPPENFTVTIIDESTRKRERNKVDGEVQPH